MNLIVEIRKLGHRGVGIGHHEGKVVMVPLTAPGDRAEVRMLRSHRSYDEARLVRLLERSPLRRKPPCPYFGECGGCHLQHLEIAHQRDLKADLFRETMIHAGNVPESSIGPLLSAPDELEYRTRLEFHVRWLPEAALGFLRLGSSQFISVEQCLLATPRLHSLMLGVRRLLRGTRLPGIDRVELCCDESGEGSVVVLGCSRPLPSRARDVFSAWPSQLPGLRGLYLRHGPWGKLLPLWESGSGDRGVRYRVLSPQGGQDAPHLEVWPGVFSQVNPAVNRILLATAISWVRGLSPGRVLDLYAGMGNLTIPLASIASEVVAVEIHPIAVRNGQANSRHLGMENLRWIRGSVSHEAARLSREGERFDLVILDPPRAGAREVLDGLVSLSPSGVLYVSCDPATLARDVRALGDRGGYRVIRCQPLDMFPQTFHTESVTLLHRG